MMESCLVTLAPAARVMALPGRVAVSCDEPVVTVSCEVPSVA